MISEADRVNKAWDKIEAWFAKNDPTAKLNPGASASDIHDLETKINLTIPEDLKVSLLRHNGVADPHWSKGNLNSIEEIIREWEGWADMEEDEMADAGPKDNEYIQPYFWSKLWIPIDADGAGNGAVVDTNPGPKGKVGQVLHFDHGMGPSGPLYLSFADYLEDACDSLGK